MKADEWPAKSVRNTNGLGRESYKLAAGGMSPLFSLNVGFEIQGVGSSSIIDH